MHIVTDGETDGIRLRIVSVRAGEDLVPTIDGGRRTEFTFLGDGRFAGSSGCNRFFGRFAEDDGALQAGPVGVTMMMCPEELMAQERWIIGAIEATTAIMRTGDRTVLLGDDSEVVLVLGPFDVED